MDSNIENQLNFYNEFKEWYFQILEDFNFSPQKDCEARDYLARIMSKKNRNWKLEDVLKSFKEKISSKEAFLIYGCGPSLERTIKIILKRKGLNFFKNFINLTADGASILLRENSIPIDAIFTDLDGITKKEFRYASFNIVHAHGDNIERLKSFEGEIISFRNIIGTTQAVPIANLINPGGFTDGDRILFFLRSLLTPFDKLYLIGMDFGSVIGKYSKIQITKNQHANSIKKKKLLYSATLINWLKQKIVSNIYFVNSGYKNELNVNLSIDEFLMF
jgi:uncharacterized Rossmann fold enzyme